MARKAHLMTRVIKDVYPRRVVVLCADGTWSRHQPGTRRERENLSRWAAVGFAGQEGVYGADHKEDGTSPDDLWTKLAMLLRKQGPLLLLVERAERTLTLLGLWSRIDRGDIVIGGQHAVRERGLCGHSLSEVSNDRRIHHSGRRVSTDGTLPAMRMGGITRRTGRTVEIYGRRSTGGNVCTIGSGNVILNVRGKCGGPYITICGLENYELICDDRDLECTERASVLSRYVRKMITVLREEGLGSLQRTVASQSLHSFRRRHLVEPIFCHEDALALDLDGESYYGGRCEAFAIGKIPGPVYHLDVTAAYASICRDHRVPAVLAGSHSDTPSAAWTDLLDTHQMVAEVEIVTEKPAYPCRDRRLGVTVWPVGRFRTTLSHPELLRAVQSSAVSAWHRCAWYRASPVLQGWAHHLLELRSNTGVGVALGHWVKAMANCLVGKLGQRDRQWVDTVTSRPVGQWAEWWEKDGDHLWSRWRRIAGHAQQEHVGGWAYNASPAIAAYITSAMRCLLLDMMEVAGRQRVYYCDTDSLFTDETGYLRLTQSPYWGPGEPGKLGIKRVSRDVTVYGVKQYVEDGRATWSGVSLRGEIVHRGRGIVERRPSVNGCCRTGCEPKAERLLSMETLAERYRHGRVTEDGIVFPLRYE